MPKCDFNKLLKQLYSEVTKVDLATLMKSYFGMGDLL